MTKAQEYLAAIIGLAFLAIILALIELPFISGIAMHFQKIVK